MWDEIKEAVSDFFADLKEWFYDVFVDIFSGLLGAMATAIEAIDLPDFFTTYAVGDYIHSDVLWFLTMSGVGDALAVIGVAYVFRIIRRIVTLGIW